MMRRRAAGVARGEGQKPGPEGGLAMIAAHPRRVASVRRASVALPPLLVLVAVLVAAGLQAREFRIYDDFDDGSIADCDPICWRRRMDAGQFDARTGDLRICGGTNGIWAYPEKLVPENESVRTRMRLEPQGNNTVYGWVMARANNSGNLYCAVLGSDGWLSIERYPTPEIVKSRYIPRPDRDHLMQLDIRSEVRDDVEGVVLELRVWPEGEAPPDPDIDPERGYLEYWDPVPLLVGFAGVGMSMNTAGGWGCVTFRDFEVVGPDPGPGACDVVRFADDFDDGSITDRDPVRWSTGGGTFDAGAGDLRVCGGQGYHWAAPDEWLPGNESVRARVHVESAAASLFVRADGTNTDYLGGLDVGGGIWLERALHGSVDNIQRGSVAWNPVDDYLIQLDVHSEVQDGVEGVVVELRVWHEGSDPPDVAQFEYWDPTPLGLASVGLGIWVGGGTGCATFRDFEAEGQDPRPEAEIAASPSSGGAPLDVALEARNTCAARGCELVRCSWDLGDGTVEDGDVVEGQVPSVTHTYSAPGMYVVRLTLEDDRGMRGETTTTVEVRPTFRRGEVTGDEELDTSDAVALLDYVFLGGSEPPCFDAADSNDDGEADISDAIYLLGYLYLGRTAPPPPFPECGVDPTGDELDCASFPPCE
jgi:hypothetical protein